MKYNVYPIMNGCSRESIFTGTLEECKEFTRLKREKEKDFDWILLKED